jgi:hypothetical protein
MRPIRLVPTPARPPKSAPTPDRTIPLLSSSQDFLFGAPLYAEYNFGDVEDDEDNVIRGMFCDADFVLDGHCCYCKRSSTFVRSSAELQDLGGVRWLIKKDVTYLRIRCTRDREHEIYFTFRIHKPIIQKIGQYPSLADIANDESRSYREVLKSPDNQELHRAIGLAAHGVGVGSFVYLRRVFERLITRRFEEFKIEERWDDADFVGKRMYEKIELLEYHLPDFLVRNKKMYSILSRGIHDLREQECLNAFEMLKHAIFFILAEDKHKKGELERRRLAEQAIAAFAPDKD